MEERAVDVGGGNHGDRRACAEMGREDEFALRRADNDEHRVGVWRCAALDGGIVGRVQPLDAE